MIETERLRLRPWRPEDRAAFLEMSRTAEVMEHLGGLSSPEQVDAAIARMNASQATHGYCFWAIERRGDAAFLGFCGLKRANEFGTPIEGELEIGWRLRRDSWGVGYAREAADATLTWAWANTDAPRVVAITVPANRRSWGLMERLGMVRTPVLDFGHPLFATDHPLHRHIAYVAERPAC
jgi:RimJ/RimL family protein N-acetyltransferase